MSTTLPITTMRPLRTVEKQWLFSPPQLDHTPSRADGISLTAELEGRRETILYMRSLWLRVAAITGETDAEATHGKGPLTVGATLVHRFYMRRSLKDFEPKLLAPVMMFLASKVEEAPLRLRHIVNACLAKFEPTAKRWDPEQDADVQPVEYRRWEKDILATEEVALEALCFDMVVEQPWPILWRGVKGLNSLWAEGEGDAEGEAESSAAAGSRAAINGNGSGSASGNAKGKSRATEEVVTEIGWSMLNEGFLAPLPVLYPAPVLALATFALILAMVDEQLLADALAAAAELGERLGLNTEFDETQGAGGEDMSMVKDATQHFIEYCNMGIIDKALPQYIKTDEPTQPHTYRRRFKVLPSGAKEDKVNGRAANGVREENKRA